MFSPQDSIVSEVIRCHYVHLSLSLSPSPSPPIPPSLSDPMSLFPCFSVACIIYHPGVASERTEFQIDGWGRSSHYNMYFIWFLFFIWQQSTELFLSKLKIPEKEMLHSAWNTSEIKDLKRFSISFCDGILERGVIAMANGLGQGWPGVRRVLSVTWW